MKTNKLKPLLAAIAFAFPFAAAHAASDFETGGGALAANAPVDFTIVIPKILYLRVGTGTDFADNAAVNLITFDVGAANVGDGTPVAATGGSGDIGNGVVTARLIGNGGAISLNVTTPGALTNGLGDSISYGQITTAAAALGGVPLLLSPPVLADGAGTAINVPAVGRVVNRGAQWTYAYANAAPVGAGTYGGVNVQNGRATYTASLP